MNDETPAKRGEVAWRDYRDAISKRNAEARKRGRAERESHDRELHALSRERARDEAEQLRLLNARISKERAG
jgi:hypothetical protein